MSTVPEEVLFKRVLLIEDDSSHALLTTRAIRELSGEVRHASRMADAFALIPEFVPSVILTDLHLGSDVAFDRFDELRRAAPDAPIVVLTVSTALQDASEAMRRGARDFVVKNFDRDFGEVLRFSLVRLHAQLLLEEERRRLESQIRILYSAIESSPDGLAVAGQDGHISYANSAFREFIERCGGSAETLQQLFGARIMGRERLLKQIEAIVHELEPGVVSHTEVTFEGERDLAYDLMLTLPKTSAAGTARAAPNTREVVLWAREVTEERRRQRFQREILSTTTHDLKGPLGAILNSAELLGAMNKDPDKVYQISLRVGSSARGALTLIDEFLSARRIQEGSMILKPMECDITPILREVVDEFRTQAEPRAISLRVNGADVPVRASVDRLGLSRVAGNLVSNAIKFTPKGGAVTVGLEDAAEEVRLTVEDTGTGMEPSDIGRLFNRFSRLERHQEIGGTGLGLFVVKAIVSAHGGSISVTSAVGVGTRFEIVLPKRPPVNERGELICLDF